MLRAASRTVHRARALRREMTLPELQLWYVLKQRPSGLKSRRQHPAGPYVLDFFCTHANLCIEVDGEAHDRGDQPAFDASRDEWLTRHGIATRRVSARDVLSDLDAVVRGIVAACASPLHHPALPESPPPRPGEVW